MKTITIKNITFELTPVTRQGFAGYDYSFVHPAGHTCAAWVNASYVDTALNRVVKSCEDWKKRQNRNNEDNQ